MVAIAHSSISKRRSLSPAAYDEARQREDGSFRSSGVTRRAARAGRPQGEFFSQYSPYGKLIRSEGPMAERNPFRFSTKYLDTESGLYYYGLRYYDPHLGRFINRDPIEEAGGLNLYAAFNNDPINRIDVNGMYAWKLGLQLSSENIITRNLWGVLQTVLTDPYESYRDVMSDVARNHSVSYRNFVAGTADKLATDLGAAKTLEEYDTILSSASKTLGVAMGKIGNFVTSITGDNFDLPVFAGSPGGGSGCGEGINIKIVEGRGAQEGDVDLACSQIRSALKVKKPDGSKPYSVQLLEHVVAWSRNTIRVVGENLEGILGGALPESGLNAIAGVKSPAIITYSPRMTKPRGGYSPTATLVHEAAHASLINQGKLQASRKEQEQWAEYWENEFKYFGGENIYGSQNDEYHDATTGKTYPVSIYEP